MIDPKNVEFIAAVGRGTFGEVVHAKWDGMDVRAHARAHTHTLTPRERETHAHIHTHVRTRDSIDFMQVAVKLLRGFDGGDAGDVIADFLEEAKARAAALRPRRVAAALSDAAMRHVALRCKHAELLQKVATDLVPTRCVAPCNRLG